MDKRRVMGKPIKRLDGLEKSTGRAKYSSDHEAAGMLFGALLTSPHAHARITSIDTSAAEKMPGVTAVRSSQRPATKCSGQAPEIASVAAITEEIANDAVRKIKVSMKSCRTWCARTIWPRPAIAPKPPASRSPAIPTRPSRKPTPSVEGHYGIPVITHCCLEPHGKHRQWSGDSRELLALHAECFRHRRRSRQRR